MSVSSVDLDPSPPLADPDAGVVVTLCGRHTARSLSHVLHVLRDERVNLTDLCQTVIGKRYILFAVVASTAGTNNDEGYYNYNDEDSIRLARRLTSELHAVQAEHDETLQIDVSATSSFMTSSASTCSLVSIPPPRTQPFSITFALQQQQQQQQDEYKQLMSTLNTLVSALLNVHARVMSINGVLGSSRAVRVSFRIPVTPGTSVTDVARSVLRSIHCYSGSYDVWLSRTLSIASQPRLILFDLDHTLLLHSPSSTEFVFRDGAKELVATLRERMGYSLALLSVAAEDVAEEASRQLRFDAGLGDAQGEEDRWLELLQMLAMQFDVEVDQVVVVASPRSQHAKFVMHNVQHAIAFNDTQGSENEDEDEDENENEFYNGFINSNSLSSLPYLLALST